MLFSLPVFAQPRSELDRDRPWTDACETALTNLVNRDHPHAEKVQVLADTEYQYQASNAETGVAGDGQYMGGDDRWHQFSFTCIYNIRYGGVSSVSYDVYDVSAPTSASAMGEQVRMADDSILLSGPAPYSEKIGEVAAGTTVTILQESNHYFYVKIGDTDRGWVPGCQLYGGCE